MNLVNLKWIEEIDDGMGEIFYFQACRSKTSDMHINQNMKMGVWLMLSSWKGEAAER